MPTSLISRDNAGKHEVIIIIKIQLNTDKSIHADSANAKDWSNVGLMLGQRLRCRSNIKPALGQRLVFAAGSWEPDYDERVTMNQKTVVMVINPLIRHNQANIMKKSVFLFWLFNIAIRCEHVHRLELRKSFTFWVVVAA